MRPGHQQGTQRTRNATRQRHAGHECRENNGQGHQAHYRIMQNVEQRQETDQDQGDGGQRSQQAGSRHQSASQPRHKGTRHLEDPRQENRADANVPGVYGRLRFVIPQLLPGMQEGGPQHKQYHGNGAGCVQPQRHGRHIVPPGPPGQGQGHPKKHQVAEQHADGRAGNHVLQGKRCRKVKNPGQQADRQQQVGDII